MAENASAKLQVELGLTDNASPKAREAGGAFRALGDQLQEVGKVAAGFAIGNLGAQLSMGIAEHIKEAITEVENFGNQVFQLQQRIGISSQSASGLLSVFERFGVSADESNRVLDFFSRGLRNNIDATEGGIEAAGHFQGVLAELGVTATDAQGHFRPVNDVLADVVDRLHALNGDGQTAARAMALFGRAGADLAPVLNLSKQEFLDLQAEAQRLGVVLTQQNVNDVRLLAMAHHDLDEATRGLSVQLGLLTIGPLTTAATGAKDLAAAINDHVLKALHDAGAAVDDYKKKLDSLPHLKPEDQKVVDQVTGADKPNMIQGPSLGDMIGGLGHAKDAIGGFIRQNGLLPDYEKAANPTVDDIVDAIHDPFQAAEMAKMLQTPSRAASNLPRIAQDEINAAHPERYAPGPLTNEEKLKQLNVAELAGGREMELIQNQLTVLNREDLGLVQQRATAELAVLPIKQQQAELEVQLLETSKQRAQIDRESAVQRAQLAAMPSSAALEDNQYKQQLLQAQIKAGILSGHGIPDGAIQQLIGLKRGEAGLQVGALESGHDVTLAQRAQMAGNVNQQLDTADIRKQQADLAINAAQKQRDLDNVNAEIRRQQLEKTPESSQLEGRRRALEDQLFDIHQRQANLNGANPTVNVSLTVNETTGALDYDKLLKDLATAVLEAVKRATGRTEAPAPAFAPGASF